MNFQGPRKCIFVQYLKNPMLANLSDHSLYRNPNPLKNTVIMANNQNFAKKSDV